MIVPFQEDENHIGDPCCKCKSPVQRESAFCDSCLQKIINWVDQPYVDGGVL